MASKSAGYFLTVRLSDDLEARVHTYLEGNPQPRSEFIRAAIERHITAESTDERRYNNSLLFLHLAVDNLLQQAGNDVRNRVHAAHRQMTGRPVPALQRENQS